MESAINSNSYARKPKNGPLIFRNPHLLATMDPARAIRCLADEGFFPVPGARDNRFGRYATNLRDT